tara:strand:+ start:45 stop:668 length:624 start_codon:yes stop_codon:yes gene_type:complete
MKLKFDPENITITQIREIMLKKHYNFYEKGDYNVNIIGIRNSINKSNSFDDFLFFIYKENNDWIKKCYEITTDAGSYWLENPSNRKGTAILIPNQYSSAYKIDKHQGKYDSLCQRIEKVQVWRDNNKDNILDFNIASKEWGFFGINIHRSNPHTESFNVNKWSAGCQVFKKVADFNNFMTICKKSSISYGNKFTYTLLETTDFNLKK